MPEHGLSKDDVRAAMQQACAIAHGCGYRLSLLELCVLVLKDGMPSEEERERILQAKLREDGDNTTLSSPSD